MALSILRNQACCCKRSIILGPRASRPQGARSATVVPSSSDYNQDKWHSTRCGRDARGPSTNGSRHYDTSPTDADHLRLIKLATNPAPKPLSIFTTVTFDAHELSMP